MRRKSIAAAALLLGMIVCARAEPVGWLGVYNEELSQPMQAALSITHGVLVTDVVDKSPADKAGLKVGDVILATDSEDILTAEDLRQYVSQRPGQKVHLQILRQCQSETLLVELGTRERQLEFSLGDLPTPEKVVQNMQPMASSLQDQYLEAIRSLRTQIDELQREIERLRKDLKKIEK